MRVSGAPGFNIQTRPAGNTCVPTAFRRRWNARWIAALHKLEELQGQKLGKGENRCGERALGREISMPA